MNEQYSPDWKLSDVIAHNPLMLMAMSRFGISLGFGDKTVAEICEEQQVDCPTFLAVANYISFGTVEAENISLPSLMSYLDNAHAYFLDFCLPAIRKKLIDAIGISANNEVSLLILKFYDEYVAEVHRHMDYESKEVFTYVKNLIEGRPDAEYAIDIFARHHHSIHDKLQELKDILIRYLPQKDSNMLNAVLFDIINCEQDLTTHCRVEDVIFVPSVRKLECKVAKTLTRRQEIDEEATECRKEPVSDRERDIIECVARGMSNKEIADRLCISINTVTTHRRNIAQKLQIHSSAGLAIYAVINGIINIDEIKDGLKD